MGGVLRVLFLLNAFIAGCVLVAMVARQGFIHEVSAAETAGTAAVRLIAEGGDRTADGLPEVRCRRGMTLEFGEPMVGREAIDQRLDEVPVQLDPPRALSGWWRAFDRLELLPDQPLDPATRYRLCLDPELRTLGGEPLHPIEVGFATPGLRFLGSSVLEAGRVRELAAAAGADGLAAARARFGAEGLRGAKRLRGYELRFDLPLVAADLDALLGLQVDGLRSEARSVDEWPETDGEVSEAGTRFLLLADEAGLMDGTRLRSVELVLGAGLRPRGRAVATDAPIIHVLSHAGWSGATADGGMLPLAPPRCRWEQGDLVLEWGTRVALPLPGALRFEPPLDFQVQPHWRGLRIVAAAPAGQNLELRLAEGFPGIGSQRLEAAWSAPLRVPDLPTRARFSSQGRILSARARPELELSCSNVTQALVSLRTMYPNNLVQYAQQRSSSPMVWGAWRSERIVLAGPHNEVFHHQLDLGPLLGDRHVGLHEVRVQALDERGRHFGQDTHHIQITDLGLSARVRDDSVAVRVYGLAKGEPREGAEVRVYTRTQQVLAEDRTDADGLVLLRFPTAHDDRRAFLVEARVDGDSCFVDPSDCGVELYEDAQRGRPWPEQDCEAWLHTDRGIVRPGGTLHLTALVRDGGGRAPFGIPLRLEWRDPSGRLAGGESFETPDSGMILASFAVPEDAPTGAWRASLLHEDRQIGALGFRVDAFVPDRLEVAFVEPEARTLDRPVELELQAHWLEGTPAADRPVLVELRYDHGFGTPDGLEGWHFGPLAQDPPPGALAPLQLRTGPDGRLRFRVPPPRDPGPEPYLTLCARAEVQDPSGRAVHCTLRHRLAVREPLLGILVEAGTGGRPDEVALRLVDAAGHEAEVAAEGIIAELRIERHSRRWQVQDHPYGGTRWVRATDRELVHRQDLLLRHVETRVELPTLPPLRSGRYVVVCGMGDRRVEAPLDGTALPESRLALDASQAVRPGQAARLVVDSPFAGQAMLTLEGRGIVALRRVGIAAGRNELELQVPADVESPNLHAVLSLTRPMAGNEGPYWSIASTPVMLDRPQQRLTVRLRAPDRIEPGRDCEVTVEAPGARHAVVFAVDEGILRLTGHAAPDPIGFFEGRRRLDGRGLEAGRTLYGKPGFPRDVVEGGGEGATLGLRLLGSISSRIRPLVRASELLVLDEAGRANTRFRLPDDHEGRLRLVAVAAGERGTGAAVEPLRVEAALGLRLALPRMLAPGDRSTAVLSLANRSGATGRVVLELEPRGGLELQPRDGLVRDGERWRLELPLEDGATPDLDLGFVAGPEAGGQGLRVRAHMDGLQRELEVLCEVRSLALFLVDRQAFAGSGELRLPIPGRWAEGGPKARLRVGAGPELQLLPALSSLVGYPYGCVEQTTSRAFAVLGCARLLDGLEAENGLRGSDGVLLDPDACIDAAIRRLFSMQGNAGGLASWPGGDHEDRFGTLYALDFLLAAEEQGHVLSPESRAALLDRVEQWLRRDESCSTRIYALLCLLRAGRPVGSYLEPLVAAATRYDDRYRLVLARRLLGRSEEAAAALATIDAGDGDTRETGGFLRSPIQALALELRARIAVAPTSQRTTILIDRLTRLVARPRSLTTQEAGQCLRALAGFYALFADRQELDSLRVSIGDREHALVPGRTLELDLAGVEELRIRGEGRFFGSLELSGFRSDLEAQQIEGLELRRSIRPLIGDRTADDMPEHLVRGRPYEVVVEGQARYPLENLCLTAMLSGGLEPDGGRTAVHLERFEPAAGMSSGSDGPDAAWKPGPLAAVELRDDRVLLFTGDPIQGRFRLRFRVRAVFPGSYVAGPLQVESLYEPERAQRLPATSRVEVRPD